MDLTNNIPDLLGQLQLALNARQQNMRYDNRYSLEPLSSSSNQPYKFSLSSVSSTHAF